jgi:hypothetical protein
MGLEIGLISPAKHPVNPEEHRCCYVAPAADAGLEIF